MNILKHPIYKSIYDLCLEIEKLPASEQATKCVVMASALEVPADELLREREDLQNKLTDLKVALDFSELACERRGKERDQLAAKCAEMRIVIESFCFPLDRERDWNYCAHCGNDSTSHSSNCRVSHALSNDCGKGWLSPSERENLEAKCAALQRDLDLTAANYIRELAAVDRSKDMIAAVEREREKLEAKCAEKTMVIQNFITFGLDGTDLKEVNHALSDDCGKGWLSPEKKELLRRKLICLKEVVCTEDSALVQEALDEIQ